VHDRDTKYDKTSQSYVNMVFDTLKLFIIA